MDKKTLYINVNKFVEWYFDKNARELEIENLIEEGIVSLGDIVEEVGYIPIYIIENKEMVDRKDIVDDMEIYDPSEIYHLVLVNDDNTPFENDRQKNYVNKIDDLVSDIYEIGNKEIAQKTRELFNEVLR